MTRTPEAGEGRYPISPSDDPIVGKPLAIRTPATERAAIVCYLREKADRAEDLRAHLTLVEAADAIEAGDHLKVGEGN